MDPIKHEHVALYIQLAEYTLYMYSRHGHAAWRHAHAPLTWTCSMNMDLRYQNWTCNIDMDMQHGHERASSMQYRHGHQHGQGNAMLVLRGLIPL
jgi:hypothetical protein